MDLGELGRLCGARHGCHGLRLLDRLTPVVQAAAMGRPIYNLYHLVDQRTIIVRKTNGM